MAHFMAILTDATIKVTLILVFAGVTSLVLYKSAAAVRHLIWSLAVSAALLVPLFSASLPHWGVVPRPVASVVSMPVGRSSAMPANSVPPARAQHPSPRSMSIDRGSTVTSDAGAAVGSTAAPHVDAPTRTPSPPFWSSLLAAWRWWVAVIWFSGLVGALLPRVLGTLSLWQLERRSTRVADPAWQALADEVRDRLGVRRKVALLITSARAMPMTWGLLPYRPARVLLPAEAEDWSADRKQAVLLHELAHIKRHDCLTQVIAQLACAMHWFNPFIWLASHRMLIERERACDDLALAAGQRPSSYAQHLLDIAVSSRISMLAAAAGIAMARRSGMERRLLAVLDEKRSRRALSRTVVTLAAAVVTAIVVPVAMVSAQSQTKPSTQRIAAATQPSDQRIDRLALIQSIMAARVNATRNFHHLYIEGTYQIYKKNKAGQWVKTPQRTYSRSWYQSLGHGPFRIDYDPQVSLWIDGARPYSQEYYTVVYNGKQFRRIEDIYDHRSKTFTPSVPEKHSFVPPRGRDALYYWPFDNGMGVLPQAPEDYVDDILPLLQHPPVRVHVQIDLVHNHGQPLIRITTRYAVHPSKGNKKGVHFAVFLNPNRGYMTQRIVADLPGRQPFDRYRVTKWKHLAGDAWFPAQWTHQLSADNKQAFHVSRVGYYDPAQSKAIFSASDIKLHVPSPTPPAGPHTHLLKASRPHVTALLARPKQFLPPRDVQLRRVYRAIYIIRHQQLVDRAPKWAAALRDLVKYGHVAAPILCAESEHPADDFELRAIGFALRGINDPRTVPWLIKALPKGQSFANDYGVSLYDGGLYNFMAKYQLDPHSRFFRYPDVSFGRSVHEISAALIHITGHKDSQDYLRCPGGQVTPKMVQQVHEKLKAGARRWRTWWKHNSHRLVGKRKIQAFARQVRQIRKQMQKDHPIEKEGLRVFGPPVPLAQDVRLTSVRTVFLPYTEAWNVPAFLDFDTGRILTRGEGNIGGGSFNLDRWYVQSPFDASVLAMVPHPKTQPQKFVYTLQGHDTHVWHVSNQRWKTIAHEIAADQGPIRLGRQGPHSSFDPWVGKGPFATIGAYTWPSTYIFNTRDGRWGICQMLKSSNHPPGVKLRYRMFEPRLTLGPVIQKTLKSYSPIQFSVIDLETEKVFKSPKQTRLDRPYLGVRQWIESHGVDASLTMYQNGDIGGLMFFHTSIVKVSPSAWSHMGPAKMKMMIRLGMHRSPWPLSDKDRNTPAPYPCIFQTQDGALGILRITSIAKDHRSLTIQYRLVRTASVQSHQSP